MTCITPCKQFNNAGISNSLFTVCVILVLSSNAMALVKLPGTQPNEGGIELAKVQQCQMCHSKTPNGDADPFFSWQGGMMAQAARDPVYRAALAIANQDIKGVGEFCWRCHTPRGWLEGRSTPSDGSQLNREDLHGVSCDACHRLVDIQSKKAGKFAKSLPPGLGNAMMVADPGNVVYGPYGDGKGAMPHQSIKSAFHASSQLCATCHNVSNPLHAKDVNTQAPHEYGHIERTYSEWSLSDYAKMGQKGTCQSCHYPLTKNGGQASRFGKLKRSYFAIHGPVGGSTWIQQATYDVWNGKDMNLKALNAAKQRALKLLQTAAKLELININKKQATLRITNLTGHKLPTGYPEGRRMWVNVIFRNASGETIKEMGRYGQKEVTLLNKKITVSTLLDPDHTRVYENLPGLSKEQAAKYNKQPGPSFHFVLNDIIVKDNRIPPKGFNNAQFTKHLCQPIQATYADGQYWDDFSLQVPVGTKRINIQLMYQSVSWEYIQFLVTENHSDNWSKRLLDVWMRTDQCPPQIISKISSRVNQ